jgi:galactose mutarotase-like enzyme
MPKKTWILTSTDRSIHEAEFSLPPDEATRAATKGFKVFRRPLHGGLREGVDAIEIDNGRFRFVVVPTRGMGLWKGWLGETQIGWQSPVKGPVHPQFVPLSEPTGLGWLEGFDELMCRCGLESNGAPDLEQNGVYKYPLHGRIANRPAHQLELTGDSDKGEMSLTGVVDETRFLFQKLRLKATFTTKINQSGLRITDEVTNMSGNPAELQMLYHVNFGPPILDPGAKVVAPVKALVPRDARAAEGVKTWDSYPNEQAGFSEQVYFFELLSDSEGATQVLLKNAHATAGVSLRYSTRQLPYFTLWKNTPLAADGYVTGLEPGTNFPNPRSFEAEQKRVVQLKPGQTVKFEVDLDIHGDAAAVSSAEQAVARLQGGSPPKVFATPQAGWTRVSQG